MSTYAGRGAWELPPPPIRPMEPKPEWRAPSWWKPEYFDCLLYEYKTQEQLQTWLYNKNYREKNAAYLAERNAKRRAKEKAKREERIKSGCMHSELALLAALDHLGALENTETISPEEYLQAIVAVGQARKAFIEFVQRGWRYGLAESIPMHCQVAPEHERIIFRIYGDMKHQERLVDDPPIASSDFVEFSRRRLKETREGLYRRVNDRLAALRKQRQQETDVTTTRERSNG